MASSLLVLLDDIATILDDVALLTKVAATKTAGVLGDDLALNAQQVAGVKADRELPVVWAVAKGSFINKAILVPSALLLSAVAPWSITPLLMAGGLFLCFEGFEKVAHKLLHSPSEDASEHAQLLQTLSDESVDVLVLEKEKIKGAVRTDFILSTEIIVITLGTVAGSAFITQLSVLAGVAVLMTVGVYGLVAGIVKIDDLGLYLTQRQSGSALGAQHMVGRGLLRAAPLLMKSLTVLGTLAMFLVGGGILAHGWHSVGAWMDGISQLAGSLAPVALVVLNTLFGVLAGGVALVAVKVITWARSALYKK
jgi:predicted DNA repair protein MutK